jgi:mitogen-activated protein kinase kinase
MKQIMMELEVLHRSSSPFIIDFNGAFFAESCVYYCMEFMDAGSIDHLYPDPSALVGESLEPILAKVAHSIVSGLVFLKEKLSIIHRDVKPSNILVNTKGIVKLCDFGVSGKLIQSMAKTNIGCQSYMSVRLCY